MRILSARIFSKSFGGKIKKFSADVTYRKQNLKKLKRCMRILSARKVSWREGFENLSTDVWKQR